MIKIQIKQLKTLEWHVPWKSVCRVGEYLFVRISLLHKPCRPGTGWLLFYSSPNTSWQRCRVFLKAQMKTSSSCTQDQREARYCYTFLNKAGKDVHLNKMYFKICINNSWLPCKVVSVPLGGPRCLLSGRQRWSTCVAVVKNVPALAGLDPAAPLCDCCKVRRLAQSRRASLLFPEGCKEVWQLAQDPRSWLFSVDSGHSSATPHQCGMAQVQLRAPWQSWCALWLPD